MAEDAVRAVTKNDDIIAKSPDQYQRGFSHSTIRLAHSISLQRKQEFSHPPLACNLKSTAMETT
jgi:hypothetical protein